MYIYIYIFFFYIHILLVNFMRSCRGLVQRFASLRVYDSRSIVICDVSINRQVSRISGRPVDAKRRGNLNSSRSSLEVMTVMDFAIVALRQPMMSFVISSSSRDSPANTSDSNSQERYKRRVRREIMKITTFKAQSRDLPCILR